VGKRSSYQFFFTASRPGFSQGYALRTPIHDQPEGPRAGDTNNMADFIQSSQSKNSVRTLATPIPDVAAFDAIVQAVMTNNPFGCVEYISAGVTHNPVEKTRENYTVRIVYQDNDAKRVGNDSGSFNTVAGYTAGAAALIADTALAEAHGGTPVRDTENDSFSATLRCHDPNGELYNVTITRTRVTLQSYADDAILGKVETWADTVPALA